MTDSSDDKGGNQKTPYEVALFRKLICSPANPWAQGVMNWPGETNQSHKERSSNAGLKSKRKNVATE